MAVGPEGVEVGMGIDRLAAVAVVVSAAGGELPDPVTMVHYYPGKEPSLDVYAGKVVQSHPMPPAAGCTTNVEIEVTDRQDACMVRGHHNLLFCGDYARSSRLFAQLYKIHLAETGFKGRWPI
jgi:hypothetical protein